MSRLVIILSLIITDIKTLLEKPKTVKLNKNNDIKNIFLIISF